MQSTLGVHRHIVGAVRKIVWPRANRADAGLHGPIKARPMYSARAGRNACRYRIGGGLLENRLWQTIGAQDTRGIESNRDNVGGDLGGVLIAAAGGDVGSPSAVGLDGGRSGKSSRASRLAPPNAVNVDEDNDAIVGRVDTVNFSLKVVERSIRRDVRELNAANGQ